MCQGGSAEFISASLKYGRGELSPRFRAKISKGRAYDIAPALRRKVPPRRAQGSRRNAEAFPFEAEFYDGSPASP